MNQGFLQFNHATDAKLFLVISLLFDSHYKHYKASMLQDLVLCISGDKNTPYLVRMLALHTISGLELGTFD